MSASSTSRGGSSAERRLAQLGRAPRHAERGVERRLVGRVRQRAERVDVRAAPGRANELGAEAARLGRDQLDRNALDGDADRAPSERSTTATICGRRSNASSAAAGSAVGTTTASSARRVDPAPRVARDLAAERGGDAAEQAAGLGQRAGRVAASPRRPCAQPVEHLPLGRGPDPGHVVQPARERGRAELVRRAHVERGADLEHALRRRGRSAGRGRSAPAAARAPARRAPRSGRSRRAPRAARRFPARSRAARARGRRGRGRRPARASSRTVSAARR